MRAHVGEIETYILGALFLALSGVALGYGVLDQMGAQLCAPGNCSEITLYPLGRSLYLWGALYYAVVGTLAFLGRRKFSISLMAFGVAAHTSLVVYGWISAGVFWFCPVCITLWLVLVSLTAASLLAGGGMESGDKKWPVSLGISAAVLVVWFLAFPAGGTGGHATVAGNPPAARAADAQDVRQPAALAVETPDGEEILLDLQERPALLFAWWCSHCSEALEAAARMEAEMPYLVAVYLRGNDAPKIEQKLQEAGLAGPYYLLRDEPPVDGVPALLRWEDGIKPIQGAEAVVQSLCGSS